MGILDTGANVSCIYKRLLGKLGVGSTKVKGSVLGATGRMERHALSEGIPVTVNGCDLVWAFEVLDDCSYGEEFIIGTDMMELVGISITGLKVIGAYGEDDNDLWMDDKEVMKVDEPDHVVKERNKNWCAWLEETLIENEKTGVAPCTAEGSIVDIKLVENAHMILKAVKRNYVPHHLRDRVQEQIEKWVAAGIIVINNEAGVINNPLLAVGKKDEAGETTKIRVCIDPSSVNDASFDDQYIVPKVKDIVEWAVGSKFYTVLDMRDGFHKFRLTHEASKLLAFTDFKGVQYRFVRCCFGLKQLVATYSRVMSNTLAKFPYARTYVDDVVIIGGATEEEHMNRVKEVIKSLTEVNLTLNPEKSNFAAPSVRLLGFMVSEEGSTICKRKLMKTLNWAPLNTGKDVMSFLGYINYFREYIPNFAELTACFNALRTVKKVEWNEELQSKYDSLKEYLSTNGQLLGKYDASRTTFVETDASGFGVGGCLYQLDENGKRVYIQFYAKSLSKAQRNYGITKKELLALVLCLKKWRQYLYGIKFTVVTDHQALTYLRTQQETNAMMARWADILFEMNMVITFKPGRSHYIPDFLSREVHINKLSRLNDKYTDNWMLHREWFMALDERYGGHDLEAFADRNNHQLEAYGTLDGTGLGDAYDLDWGSYESVYMNIPFRDVTKVISKIKRDKATVTLVVPVSLGTKWLSKVLEMCVDQPTFITHTKRTFLRNGKEECGKPPWRWSAAFRVCGDAVVPKVEVGDKFWSQIGFRPEPEVSVKVLTRGAKRAKDLAASSVDDDTNNNNDSDKSNNVNNDNEHNNNNNKVIDDSMEEDISMTGTLDETAQNVLDRALDFHLYGHIGVDAMFHHLKDEFRETPSHMLRKAAQSVKDSCITCARNTQARKGYHPSRSVEASAPFDHVCIDLTKMELSRTGNNYILVIKCVFTKFVILRPIPDKMMATIASQLLEVFGLFGFPKIIQSDNGTEFKNKLMAEWKNLGIFEHRLSTCYYPKSNGQVERVNRDITKMLRSLCNGKTTSWDLYVPLVQYYKNAAVSRSHHTAPFTLMFGRVFNLLKNYSNEDGVVAGSISRTEWEEHMRKVVQIVHPEINYSLTKYNKKRNELLDKNRKAMENLPVNSIVMTEATNKGKKLDHNFLGPFRVVARTEGGSYTLMDMANHLLPRNYAPEQLRIVSLPTPAEISHEIDCLLDDKLEGGIQHYLVRWRGYDDSHDSWEPVNSFDSLDLIAEYNRKKLSK